MSELPPSDPPVEILSKGQLALTVSNKMLDAVRYALNVNVAGCLALAILLPMDVVRHNVIDALSERTVERTIVASALCTDGEYVLLSDGSPLLDQLRGELDAAYLLAISSDSSLVQGLFEDGRMNMDVSIAFDDVMLCGLKSPINDWQMEGGHVGAFGRHFYFLDDAYIPTGDVFSPAALDVARHEFLHAILELDSRFFEEVVIDQLVGDFVNSHESVLFAAMIKFLGAETMHGATEENFLTKVSPEFIRKVVASDVTDETKAFLLTYLNDLVSRSDVGMDAILDKRKEEIMQVNAQSLRHMFVAFSILFLIGSVGIKQFQRILLRLFKKK